MNEKMVGFIRDDGGRQAAGYKGTTGDCVVRACAIMSERGYRECYDAMAAANKLFSRNPKAARSARNGVNENAWHYIFSSIGFENMGVTQADELTITETYERFGDCVVEIPRHLMAVKGGYVMDAWDSRFVSRKRRGLNPQSAVHPQVWQVWRHPSHPMPVTLPELDDKAIDNIKYFEKSFAIKLIDSESGERVEKQRWDLKRPNYASVKRHADSLYFSGCFQLANKQWHPLPFGGFFKEGSTITIIIEEVTPCG